jgi:hypothetical protein
MQLRDRWSGQEHLSGSTDDPISGELHLLDRDAGKAAAEAARFLAGGVRL